MKFNSVRTYTTDIYKTIKTLTKSEPKSWWLQDINLKEINFREILFFFLHKTYFGRCKLGHISHWFIFAIDEISVVS